jgi:outer membrane lipoprotein-sorting protein
MRQHTDHAPRLGARAALLLLVSAGALLGARVSASSAPSASDVIQRAEERFHSLRDYECRVEVESDLGKRVETGVAEMWYKQPGMLRVNITGGSKRGSVVAVDDAGQIRGHKGGLLSSFVRTMKPADKRLLTIRGKSLLCLDWGCFYRKFHEDSARPGARAAVEPHADASAPYEITLSYPEGGKSKREVYTIDPREWVMVEGSAYENDARVEHVVFRDVKMDTGVDDRWFHLSRPGVSPAAPLTFRRETPTKGTLTHPGARGVDRADKRIRLRAEAPLAS